MYIYMIYQADNQHKTCFVNDKKQENYTEFLEEEKDRNNIEKDRRVIQLRRRIF